MVDYNMAMVSGILTMTEVRGADRLVRAKERNIHFMIAQVANQWQEKQNELKDGL